MNRGGPTVAGGLHLILSPISQFEGVFICDGLNTFCGRRTSATESEPKLLDEDLKYQLFIAPAVKGEGGVYLAGRGCVPGGRGQEGSARSRQALCTPSCLGWRLVWGV